jgi:hypothetical protein
VHDGGDCGRGERGTIGDGHVIVIVRRGGEGLRRGVRGMVRTMGEAASGVAGAADTVW